MAKDIHEWLGLAFAVIMLAHLAINWSAFTKHFRKPTAWVTTSVVTAISATFLINALSNPDGSPIRQIVQSLETTAVVDLAPVFKLSESEMVARLGLAGVEVKTGQETLRQLADESGVESRKLVTTLVRLVRPKGG